MINLTLRDILKGILTEGVSDDEVLDSIQGKYYVRINYDDTLPSNGGNPKGSRVIQPMALGRTKKGFPVVRAFQIGGGSRRGAPKWKFFRLDRITSWRPMKNKKFFAPPSDVYGEYNRFGDRSMGKFIDNAKFGDMYDPLERARAERQNAAQAPKVSTKNATGPIAASQQWKRNVYTSQPNSDKYAQYARNVDMSGEKGDDYWADYDRASQAADIENQSQRPNQQNSGPILNRSSYDNYDDEDFYDVDDVDFDENNFIRNTNRR